MIPTNCHFINKYIANMPHNIQAKLLNKLIHVQNKKYKPNA